MQAPIDFKTVDSIPYRNTISLVNNFILSTTQFINKFTFLCEKKLEEVSAQIEKVEITLNILEAKLNSIPGLESISVENTNDQSSAPTDFNDISAPPPPIPPTPSVNNTIKPEEEENINVNINDNIVRVKDDPRFLPFFKMLRLGVVIPQIKMQMQAKGLDPNLLDDPDAPAPALITENIEGNDDESSEEESDDM